MTDDDDDNRAPVRRTLYTIGEGGREENLKYLRASLSEELLKVGFKEYR